MATLTASEMIKRLQIHHTSDKEEVSHLVELANKWKKRCIESEKALAEQNEVLSKIYLLVTTKDPRRSRWE